MVAAVSEGFGVSDTVGDGDTFPPLSLLHAGMANARHAAAKRMMTALGMAGSVRRRRVALRYLPLALVSKKRSDLRSSAA